MVTDPEAIPVTAPEKGSTDAMAGLLLVHVPPGGEPISVVVYPLQTPKLPAMVSTSGTPSMTIG
ncbi:hypothetical protein GCM10023093_07480 [Nemorincola caseinilytica]|uniref:Uncharacterized protein n=1 Tax=Nemorincola caseinilytica TaxID=2054315 RepID=A0ABP8N8X4_9BACT